MVTIWSAAAASLIPALHVKGKAGFRHKRNKSSFMSYEWMSRSGDVNAIG